MQIQNFFLFIRKYFIITLGLGVTALGWTGFIIPSGIVGGGLTGIASIIFFIFGINVGITTLAINIFLIAFAMKIIGKSFGVKTIYSVFIFSLFLSVFNNFITEPLVAEKMMATVTGAILCGFGASLIFIYGASVGGTDIVALIITKYKNYSLGKILLSIDLIVISLSYPLFKSIETVIYGFMMIGIIAYTIDLMITGTKQTVQFFIFSKKHKEIANEIIHVGKKGLTILPAKGGYSQKNLRILMVFAKKRESAIIFRIVKSIDPEAFITVGNVMGVYGEGYDQIK